jgi:hypothetical protein
VKLRIYLDHNMVSALVKQDMPTEEQDALMAICRAQTDGKCVVLTSKAAQHELEKYRSTDWKPRIEVAYHLLQKVAYIEAQKLLGIHSYGDQHTWINAPMIEDNPEWVKIRGLGLSGGDAEHVLNAIGRCDVLLTYDNDLLHRAQEIQKHHGLRVLKPSQLSTETGWS